MTDAEYAAWYNSLSPSTRAYTPAPGSAGYKYKNEQEVLSNAAFAAGGVTDPWGFALSGAGAPAPRYNISQNQPVPKTGGVNIQPPPPAPTLPQGMGYAGFSPVQLPSQQTAPMAVPKPEPDLTLPGSGGAPGQPGMSVPKAEPDLTMPKAGMASGGYSAPTTQPATVPQVFNKSLFGQPNTRAPGSSGPVVQAMMRRTKQPWETY